MVSYQLLPLLHTISPSSPHGITLRVIPWCGDYYPPTGDSNPHRGQIYPLRGYIYPQNPPLLVPVGVVWDNIGAQYCASVDLSCPIRTSRGRQAPLEVRRTSTSGGGLQILLPGGSWQVAARLACQPSLRCLGQKAPLFDKKVAQRGLPAEPIFEIFESKNQDEKC